MIRALCVAAALVAAAGCRPESSRKAAVAADDVATERADLEAAARKLPDHPDKVAATRQVLVEAGELAEAGKKFHRAKSKRIAVLRSTHDVVATQSGLISTLSRELPITDAARGDINEKLMRFQTRLDEAANMIEGLEKTDVDAWTDLDANMNEVMQRLDDARSDAWKALVDAPRTARGAS